MAVQLQLSWQRSLLHNKRKTGPPIGLKNLGNSCYLNSVIQCLTYTPPLANFCFNYQHSALCNLCSENTGRKRECPFCLLEERIASSLKKDLKLDTPSRILSCLRTFAGHFRCGQQEDAHEFLRYVIDACHTTCIRLKKLQEHGPRGEHSGSTVVKTIFGGSLRSLVKCLSCGFESYKVDEIMDISLDVLNSSSLVEAMNVFFQSELLDGQNKYKCEKCKKLAVATKQLSFLEAPNVLVIQLKRFEGISGRKIDKAISFEEVLMLSRFMCKTSKDRNPKYDLYGTIVHSGYSPESGHYYAYIKDAMGHWYCCNDSHVSHSTLHEVLSEKVYILFFLRSSQERQSTSVDYFFPNGVEHSASNGTNKSKNQEITSLPKSAREKHFSESHHLEDVSGIRNEKVHPEAQIKLSSSGGVTHKNDKKNGIVMKSVEINGEHISGNSETRDRNACLLLKGNGNYSSVDSVNGLNVNSTMSATHDNDMQDINILSKKEDLIEGKNSEKTVSVAKPAGDAVLVNGFVNDDCKISGSKRKTQEKGFSFPFTMDVESHIKAQQLKEMLEKETCLALRSCGWVDEVYNSMSSTKRKLEGEYGMDGISNDKMKEKLIAEVKEASIVSIPVRLKENLIQRLRSFYHPDGG